MLAKLARELPTTPGLLYEPKWDGFRCIVFRDGDDVELGSRNEKPLTRYFPDLIDPLRAALGDRAVVDGEIVIATDAGLDFDLLSLRIHPAASRVATLAEATPAAFVAFDLLAEGDDDLREQPFSDAAGATRVDARVRDATGVPHAGDAGSRRRPRLVRPLRRCRPRRRGREAARRGRTARASARCSR